MKMKKLNMNMKILKIKYMEKREQFYLLLKTFKIYLRSLAQENIRISSRISSAEMLQEAIRVKLFLFI